MALGAEQSPTERRMEEGAYGYKGGERKIEEKGEANREEKRTK